MPPQLPPTLPESHPWVKGEGERTPDPGTLRRMKQRLADRIGSDIQEDVPLRDLTTLKIGGPARFFCEAGRAETLAAALSAAREEGLEVLLLGGGSNLLVLDGGFDGLVIHNRILGVEVEGATVRVAAGESFHELIEALAAGGLAGLGFAAGVPGTVGGAVSGNAGCYGKAIGDYVIDIEVVERGGEARRTIPRADLAFGYRHSALPASGAVVAAVTLQLEAGDPDDLRREIEGNVGVRQAKHPVDLPSAGSWFRNLPPAAPGERRVAAGLLLDQVGCKGLRVGDAGVFDRHANMVVNLGGATAADVLELTTEMKRRVQGRFGVALEEEVRQVGIEADSEKRQRRRRSWVHYRTS